MTLVSKLHQQWSNDPEYKAAYEAQRSEFEIVSATIAAKSFTKQSLISKFVCCVYKRFRTTKSIVSKDL